ncbi:MAG: PAS domain S-box protein [Acidobacteria bacterium]|nr:MAG: PAS domain S-box protein [Acidobacteriota bacterium]
MNAALLRQAVAQAGDGLLLADSAGVVLYANAAFARMAGRRAEDLHGRLFDTSFVMDRTPDDVRLDLRRTITNDRVWRGELSGTTRDGAPFAWRASVNPFRDDTGSPAGYLVVCQDAGARDELEARLRQSQKMEAVGRLAGGIAHDFSNLLTVIAGCSEQLTAALVDQPELRGAVDGVKDAAGRATSLTRQLLAFSRRQVLAPEALDVNLVAADVTALLQRLIGRHIQLVTDLSRRPARVSADRSQLEQILMNLAINARDAMPRGGRLTIGTELADLDAAFAARHPGMAPGRYVLLTVEDQGCGMDPEVMTHLFEPFFTTKPDGKGTGLGLSTTYGIVKQSEGYIYATSEVGAGSRFTVCLPRLDEAPGREHTPGQFVAATPPESAGSGEVLLVVDEDQHARELACRALRERGYLVLEASNATAALQAMERRGGHVDLVLADLAAARGDGRAWAADLRRTRPGARVMFMAASGAPADASGVLVGKPFTPEQLAAAVRRALEGPHSPAGAAAAGA